MNIPDPIALSIVAPCYNEEHSIDELYRRMTEVCRATIGSREYEVVLVNDGSTDRTWQCIRALVERDPNVVGVNLSRNYGHQKALSAGLSICTGERVLIIDADLQDPPELLPEMMRLMEDGADVVYGQRESRSGESWFKLKTASAFYRLLGRLSDTPIPPDTGDFRLISRRALDIFNAMPEQYRFVRGMISWIGLKQVPLRYHRDRRFGGETKYNLRKMLVFALDALTGFSIVPLRLASWIGGVVGIIGLFLLTYTLASWFAGAVVPGWTSIMIVVLVLGSVQLFILGILGEYLGRLYMDSKRRPLFIIDDVIRSSAALQKMILVHGGETSEILRR